MDRRFLLTGIAALLPAMSPAMSYAQPIAKPRLGILVVGNLEPFWSQFRAGLSDFGYVDGNNITIEFRSAQGKLDALPRLAQELVAMRVDIIVASETPAVQAARLATRDIPIVMAPSGDPLGTGQVVSLSKPGGNVTGLSAATAELAGKSLELIRELLPATTTVAALADPRNPFTKPFLEQISVAAAALGMTVHAIMISSDQDYEPAFDEMVGKRVHAVVVQPTLPRDRVVPLVLKHRLPAVSGNRAFADAGGLLSYAASLADRYREAGRYVDRILKGSAAGDLPVQQPSRFELVVNIRSAKALGIEVPRTILLRADEVLGE